MLEDYVEYTYDGRKLSHKKNEILPFVSTWMDLENIIFGEVSHTEKDKYYISLICGILKITQIYLYTKQK